MGDIKPVETVDTGKYFGTVEEDENPQAKDNESGEAKKPDASDEDVDLFEEEQAEEEEEPEEDSEEPDQDDEPEEEEEEEPEKPKGKKAKPKEKAEKKQDWKTKFEDAESKRRITQGRADRAERAAESLKQELQDFKEEILAKFDTTTKSNEANKLLAGKRPDDLMTVEEVRQFAEAKIDEIRSQQKAAPKQKQQPQSNQPSQAEFNQFVAGQYDAAEMDDFLTENEEFVSRQLEGIPTDNYGQYYAIRAMRLESVIDGLEKKLRKQSKPRPPKRKKVPYQGPGGRSGKDNADLSDGKTINVESWFGSKTGW